MTSILHDIEWHKQLTIYCTTTGIEPPPPYKPELDYCLWWKRFCEAGHFKAMLKRTSKPKIYRYLITFTLKPDAVDKADDAEFLVVSQAERKALGFLSFVYVRELTKAGVPHFHCAVETDRILKKDRFNYYIKTYGSVDISPTKAQTIQEALNYISKEAQPKRLI